MGKSNNNSSSYSAWEIVDAVARVSRTVLMYGPPGTGKSYAAHGAALGDRKLFTITLTPDTPAAELRGHYVPVGGEFKWQDGPAIKAWREGGRLVVNEIDHAGGDALSFLMNVLDSAGTAGITLPTGETVRPADGFQAIGTMNGDPDTDLPEALRDRFPCTVHVDEAHPEAIASLPDDLQEAARGTVCAADSDRRVSLRAWLDYGKLRMTVGHELAAVAIFGRDRAPDILQALKIAKK